MGILWRIGFIVGAVLAGSWAAVLVIAFVIEMERGLDERFEKLEKKQ